MNTKPLTCRQELANINELIEFWKTVPPDSVGLSDYECDGLHCIGGYIAAAGLFGVTAHAGGMPIIPGHSYGSEVGEYLFGDRYLFNPRHDHPVDRDLQDYNDYEVAMYRMNYAKDQILRKSQDLYD